MVTSSDLSGLMAMMPALATDDAGNLRVKPTGDVDRPRIGLDRMIQDGAKRPNRDAGLHVETGCVRNGNC